MRNISILLLIVAGFAASAQDGDLLKLDKLQQVIQAEKEQIQIVNFWATCVRHALESFHSLKNRYGPKRFESETCEHGYGFGS